jgi:hypothetical protein
MRLRPRHGRPWDRRQRLERRRLLRFPVGGDVEGDVDGAARNTLAKLIFTVSS